MGSNKAGQNKKNKEKRRKKEEERRKQWGKIQSERLNKTRECIWAFMGNVGDEDSYLFYSPTEPAELRKVKIELPYPMKFNDALDYIHKQNRRIEL